MFSWQLKELIQSSLDGIKLKQETDKMNDLTKKSFIELENLMKYLKEKDYL